MSINIFRNWKNKKKGLYPTIFAIFFSDKYEKELSDTIKKYDYTVEESHFLFAYCNAIRQLIVEKAKESYEITTEEELAVSGIRDICDYVTNIDEFINDLKTFCGGEFADEAYQAMTSSKMARITIVYNFITAELDALKIAYSNNHDNNNRILKYVFDPYNNWVIDHHIQRLLSFTFTENS